MPYGLLAMGRLRPATHRTGHIPLLTPPPGVRPPGSTAMLPLLPMLPMLPIPPMLPLLPRPLPPMLPLLPRPLLPVLPLLPRPLLPVLPKPLLPMLPLLPKPPSSPLIPMAPLVPPPGNVPATIPEPPRPDVCPGSTGGPPPTTTTQLPSGRRPAPPSLTTPPSGACVTGTHTLGALEFELEQAGALRPRTAPSDARKCVKRMGTSGRKGSPRDRACEPHARLPAPPPHGLAASASHRGGRRTWSQLCRNDTMAPARNPRGVSEAEYRRITHDIAVAAARALVERNPGMTFIFVSGAGTDPTDKPYDVGARQGRCREGHS